MKYLLITIVAVVLVGCGPPEISIREAVSLGKIGAVKQHLAYGTDVNFKYENGETFLHLAASEGHWDIVALLVKKGANVKAEETIFGYTPLHYTAKYSNPQTKDEIITLLIENGADVNAKAKNGETTMDLLNDALDLPGFESLRTNTKNLLRKHGGKTGSELPLATLHEAVMREDLQGIKDFLAKGADVNAKDEGGNTQLDWAIFRKHNEIADLLRKNGGKTGSELPLATLHEAVMREDLQGIKDFLAKGADVNAKDKDNRLTALDEAIRRKKTKAADLLRKHGAKTGAELAAPNQTLTDAVFKGDIEAVKQYLAAGVDVNAKNKYGTPHMHIVALGGHKEIVELFITNGADVNAKDDNGNTPLDSADPEVANLLRKHGGKTGEELKTNRISD